MQFKENASVVTAGGQKVGRIDRVVLDPKSKELTHLVVKKGFLFTEDKVVSLDAVDTATEDQVVLKQGQDDPDEFPDFEETHYIPVEDAKHSAKSVSGGLGALAWYYPLPKGAWWSTHMGTYSGYPQPPYVRKTEVHIPDGTVALEEGARVVSSDGEHVGDVERIYADDKTQRVTHILISHGLISKSRKLIPSMWVESVSDDAVWLSVGSLIVEAMPQYAVED